ncbi:hypothetical protein DAEQUDRAFT_733754 [Daedalea quercina L-15889]|uniref:PQ-loop-domain-containing protein n=1 Tax=Daedalea quercina L-15889 TaxID=1314783 RepID=A0A165KS12_9APHY|nr:hypothetical protein DAEQUDRAFT_733754 [Daedalea quercina L-15889]
MRSSSISRLSIMLDTCTLHHDYAANILTALLCVGLIISYLPQHLRIIKAGSSEGFSPWFLLLGCTSNASAMLNIIVMQWGIIKCCNVVTFGSCVESIAGVFQLSLQWFLFTIILVLYMIYYPPHLKYTEIDVDLHDNRPPQHVKTSVKTDTWRLSITLSWVVFIHFAFSTFVTLLLLSTETPDLPGRSPQVSFWATLLGVASALLAAIQYAPQLIYTYRRRLVGALSIPMMLIQSPGAIFMVISIAVRPGTNWTTWLTYAVAGVMQGSLLVMCLLWRVRQHRLRIDDFGNPLDKVPNDSSAGVTEAVQVVVADGIESSIRVEGTDGRADITEETPLLRDAGQW